MVQLFGRSWTREELLCHTSNIDQLGGVRLATLDDGKGRGIRTAQFETGSGLAVTVLLDRGMDIGSTRYKGAALAWESNVGPAHPMCFEKDGLSFHRTWGGGLVNGCGTTYMGMPCEDQGESLGIHGRLSHMPASNVWADAAWTGDRYEIWVQGKARETGTLPFLEPGEEREYNFEVGVLANNEEIEAMTSQVIVPQAKRTRVVGPDSTLLAPGQSHSTPDAPPGAPKVARAGTAHAGH